MEGVTDAPMRALMSERGGFSFCVSEFLRVSQDVPPARTFYEHIPELKKDCLTPSGTPVQIQLLGGDAAKLAQTAQLACSIGARGIDLNFGCPAPTVNRHDGGATLLKYPDRIREIVSAVRKAVPAHLPVSAKLRLGFDSMDAIHLNADRAAEGGASWITIHGRTKVQGYMPPAYWQPIGEVRKRLSIPVVANGDIWTIDDFRRCRDETGCEHFMLGRSAMADPSLVFGIGRELGLNEGSSLEPFGPRAQDWIPLLERFVELSLPAHDKPAYVAARIKQWKRMVYQNRKVTWFDQLKRAQHMDEIFSILRDFKEV
jgi:tRNA-dihydrouridine synthase C